MAYTFDRSFAPNKQTRIIDIPHIVLKDDPDGRMMSYIPQLPNGHDYGVFLPKSQELGKPVTNPEDLRWFLHEDRKNIFECIIRPARWSEREYPEIAQTLPKSIELAIALGSEVMDDTDVAEFHARRKQAEAKQIQTSAKLAEVPTELDYNTLSVKQLRLIAKNKSITNYSKMKKEELIGALNKK